MNEFEMVEGLTALEQRQQLLAHHVKMVTRKISHALFVFGGRVAWARAGRFCGRWKRKA